MTTDYLAGIGDDESAGGSTPLPESLYPVTVSLGIAEPSAQKGTAGIHVICVVTEGAYAGFEVDQFSARWYMWTPKPDSKYYERQAAQRMGFMKNLTKVMTGKDVDDAAIAKHGCEADSIDGFWDWYRDLDPDLRIKFLFDFMRLRLWTGTNCMAKIKLTTEKMEQMNDETGLMEPMLDENDEPRERYRNEIVNIFALTHSRYGHAAWKGVYAAQQEKAFKIQFGG